MTPIPELDETTMDINSRGLLPELLILGIPQVDEQHEGIFYRIEHLKFLCIESNELPHSAMEELLVYLRAHFLTEETIAGAARVDFAEHAELHRQTLDTLTIWIDLVLRGRRDVFSLLRFLECWFERHIREEDQPFASSVLDSRAAPGGRP